MNVTVTVPGSIPRYTLLGTNISPPSYEDHLPLPKVGYVNSLEAATYCISPTKTYVVLSFLQDWIHDALEAHRCLTDF